MKNNYHIIWHNVIDSTNNDLIRKGGDCDNLSVSAALWQSSGRGQRGNSWSSEAGMNLTFSLLLRPGKGPVARISASRQFVISALTALSAVDYLLLKGIKAKIKWPNDIYVEDKKICGILIENSLRGSELTSCIIGVGINLNQTDFDASIPNPTSLKLLTEKQFKPKEELNEFLCSFDKHLQILSEKGEDSIIAKYLELMYRKDGIHEYVSSEGRFSGIIRGLSPEGLLLVEEHRENRISLKTFAFKEIAFVI